MLPVDSLHPQTQPGVLRGHKATNSPCPKYKPLQGLSTRKSNDCQKKKEIQYTRWKLYVTNHTSRQVLHIKNTSETATKKVHLTTNLKTIPPFLSGSNDLHRFWSRTSQMPKTSPTLGSMTFNTSSSVSIARWNVEMAKGASWSRRLRRRYDSLLFHSLKLPIHDLLFLKATKNGLANEFNKWYLHKTFFGINSGPMAIFVLLVAAVTIFFWVHHPTCQNCRAANCNK